MNNLLNQQHIMLRTIDQTTKIQQQAIQFPGTIELHIGEETRHKSNHIYFSLVPLNNSVSSLFSKHKNLYYTG